MAKRPRQISTSEGFRFGLSLLGQVSGTLLVSALLGALFDRTMHTGPLGLAAAVTIGSLAATAVVLIRVTKYLK